MLKKSFLLSFLVVMTLIGCGPTVRQVSKDEIGLNCSGYSAEVSSLERAFMKSIDSIGTSFNDGSASRNGDKLSEAKNKESFWCYQAKDGMWIKDYGNKIESTVAP
jgi:hypothetical protein